jgi:cytoskeletal protein CcmA (bactofilin family)
MWKKNGTSPIPHEKALSLLGEGSEVKGEFRTPGALRIEGRFEGTLRVEGRLVIASTAEVKGTIHASQVLIGGLFQGDVFAEELVEIASTATVRGEIRTRKLEAHSGSQLELRCYVGEGVLQAPPSMEKGDKLPNRVSLPLEAGPPQEAAKDQKPAEEKASKRLH